MAVLCCYRNGDIHDCVGRPYTGLISPEQLPMCPLVRGLGSSGFLEISLDRAVRNRDPAYFHPVTDEHLALWQ